MIILRKRNRSLRFSINIDYLARVNVSRCSITQCDVCPCAIFQKYRQTNVTVKYTSRARSRSRLSRLSLGKIYRPICYRALKATLSYTLSPSSDRWHSPKGLRAALQHPTRSNYRDQMERELSPIDENNRDGIGCRSMKVDLKVNPLKRN